MTLHLLPIRTSIELVKVPVHEHWPVTDHPPELRPNSVHVWRVDLADLHNETELFAILSDDEQALACRLYSRLHRTRYTAAHGMLRRILAGYVNEQPAQLHFETGAHGKPAFSSKNGFAPTSLHFNLSHSGEMALVAVARSGAVGVDVEWWRNDVQHLELAERFFSPREQQSLRAGSGDSEPKRGFFAAWSRKEAYLKATGFGISRGLHHFDVTIHPHLPAQLLEDRLDPSATQRWAMANIEVGSGYSAALVAATPVHDVQLFHAAATELPTLR